MKREAKRNIKILALHDKGLSCAYIARLFPPLTRQRVWQIVKDEIKRLSTA